MVATDIRTPPRVKTHQQAKIEEVALGKGEAIPVVLDEGDTYEIVSNTQYVKASTSEPTPSNGISTWILLNGSEQSTTQKHRAPAATTTSATTTKKKFTKPTNNSNWQSTTENAKRDESSSQKNPSNSAKPNNSSVKKPQVKDDLIKLPVVTLQDSKFKNKTPTVVGRIPTQGIKNKTDNGNNKKNKPEAQSASTTTITPPTTILPVRQRPIYTASTVSTTPKPLTTPTTSKPPYPYEIVPTTSVIVESGIVDTDLVQDTSTTEIPSTTTKRTRRPGNKKKKKNKNRRRRPTKKPAEGQLESKISDDNSTKIVSNGNISRPLSTRIYNYLAREVMPSVGVGLVGLVLTAGLAGLLLYPFGGGVAARRTYDKVSSAPSPDGHMYYYNDYSANSDIDNGQAEETVFGQVLAGMSQSESKYSNYDTQYTQPNKYRFEPSHDYGYTASSYRVPNKDNKYVTSRTPDSYDTTAFKYSTSVGASGASGSHFSDSSAVKYSPLTGISVESNSGQNAKYQTGSEYTAYSNPSDIGTQSGVYSDKSKTQNVRYSDIEYDDNNKDILTGGNEDTADKHPLTFSEQDSLIPITGSYSNEVKHRQGVLAVEHGPRNIKRRKRAIDNPMENEVDGDLLDDSTTSTTIRSSSETTTPESLSTESPTTLETLISTVSQKDFSPSSGYVEATTEVSSSEKTGPTKEHQIEQQEIPEEEFTFMTFLRRLAEMKLRLGINLLKSTTQAVARYLDTVQKRMESVVRALENRNKTSERRNTKPKVEKQKLQ